MKVFFTMTFHGDLKVGKTIYQKIIKLRHKHTSNSWATNIPNNYSSLSQKQRIEHLQQLNKDLPKADIMVTEMTNHSVTTGVLMQKAFQLKIPVLALYQDSCKCKAFRDRESLEGRLLTLEYSLETLSDVLKDGLEHLTANTDRRFTMILPINIAKHLDEIVKKGTSRSDYIRTLIQKDMKV